MFAEVVVPLPVEKTLTYAVPEHLLDRARPGMRVLVPVRSRHLTGYLVGLTPTCTLPTVKEISTLLDPEPLLTEHLLTLTRWVADYYLAPWGEVIKAALPPGIESFTRRVIVLTAEGEKALGNGTIKLSPAERDLLFSLRPRGAEPLRGRPLTSLSPALRRLEKKGLIKREAAFVGPRVRVKHERLYTLTIARKTAEEMCKRIAARAPHQARVLTHLMEKGETAARDLQRIAPAAALQALVRKGLVAVRHREVTRTVEDLEAPFGTDLTPAADPSPPMVLSPHQHQASETLRQALETDRFFPALLYGVTGSGKTEIYLRVIEEAARRGRQALVLVPEIALTPLTASRFGSRFGEKVALLHSHLSPGERFDQWRRVREGQADIVVGARSAVFAPLPRLGVIIVDEEHETSYKQEETPRYHAREVALQRARMLSCPLLLGSATPALESYAAALSGEYTLLTLPERIGEGLLPRVTVVDMRRKTEEKQPEKRAAAKGGGILSPILVEKIRERLARREQTLLLLNRRGFSTLLLCRECGFTLRCPRCSVCLIYHAPPARAICHYCDHTEDPPTLCPQCRGIGLRYVGVGTQQVEQAARTLFPGARVERMDRDTTSRRRAHGAILRRFAAREIDILVGTQMIAKGHDFPRVTLVGVVSADTGLHFPDFRSGERTFALITQVAGRAGRRDLAGEAIVQTWTPDSYVLQAAAAQDYARFTASELPLRAERSLPPYAHLARIVLSSPSEEKTEKSAIALARLCEEEPSLSWEGPAPAPHAKLRGQYRWHLLLRGEAGTLSEQARDLLRRFAGCPESRGIEWSADVDPSDLS